MPAPWLFRLARWLIRHRLRGGYRLIEWLERSGRLNVTARYAFSDRIAVEMPLWRRPNQLAECEALVYEQQLVEAVTKELTAIGRPAVLVDCGADVGLVAGLLCDKSPSIEEVVACEPNPEAREFLARNLASWPLATQCLPFAIADFTGRGRLAHPTYDDSPHAAFLQPDVDGDILVRRIADLTIDVASRCLVLKIDVEGGEQAVLRGALEMLERAPAWIVTIEAHRKVCERTGVDPCEVVRQLVPLGLVRTYIAERPDHPLDIARPYFNQLPDPPISNIICTFRSR
jgi:FkbM family methyltransferase